MSVHAVTHLDARGFRGKGALAPAALLCLFVTALRGERVTTILLGTLCLIGETLYTLGNPDQPLGWFAWLARARA